MTRTGTVAAIGALADPIRMRLYRFIADRGEAVSREEAAEALAIPLTKVKFHLERLADEGLLDTEYRRMTGKQGPGAGRPAKLYRRSTTEFHVSLPERHYDVMGDILASAVARSREGQGLDEAIDEAAYATGVTAAARVTTSDAGRGSLALADETLTALGYEAEREDDALRLRNCPFESLAKRHTALVCGSNVSYVQGVLDGTGCGELQAQLEPCPGYCCVAVRAGGISKSGRAAPAGGSTRAEGSGQ